MAKIFIFQRPKPWYTSPMDIFGFTRKKFISLGNETQHRQVIKWLSRAFQKLRTNRVSAEDFAGFQDQYNEIRSWMDLAPPPPPANDRDKARFAFVSDAVHFHRCKIGLTPKDDGLLPSVRETDRPYPAPVRPQREIWVALDGLRSLFNIGSILRTCDAAGVAGILLAHTPGGEHPKVAKTAMGAQEWLNQERTEDLYQSLMQKKNEGFTIMGVETAEGATPCHQTAWPQQLVLVLGNEEYGLSPSAMAACNAFVTIPMFGRKNSLNVANAAAVVLFQAALSPVSNNFPEKD